MFCFARAPRRRRRACCKGTRGGAPSQRSDSREPWKAERFPITARILVGHLDGRDPFRVLIAELDRRAQTHRIAKRIGKRVAAILVAHDYKYELPVLRSLLRSNIGYLGMLGSKKRAVAVRDLLREEGFTDDELARIRTPIGLDLGGKSSPEVALAIVAELVMVRSGKRA